MQKLLVWNPHYEDNCAPGSQTSLHIRIALVASKKKKILVSD